MKSAETVLLVLYFFYYFELNIYKRLSLLDNHGEIKDVLKKKKSDFVTVIGFLLVCEFLKLYLYAAYGHM